MAGQNSNGRQLLPFPVLARGLAPVPPLQPRISRRQSRLAGPRRVCQWKRLLAETIHRAFAPSPGVTNTATYLALDSEAKGAANDVRTQIRSLVPGRVRRAPRPPQRHDRAEAKAA